MSTCVRMIKHTNIEDLASTTHMLSSIRFSCLLSASRHPQHTQKGPHSVWHSLLCGAPSLPVAHSILNSHKKKGHSVWHSPVSGGPSPLAAHSMLHLLLHLLHTPCSTCCTTHAVPGAHSTLHLQRIPCSNCCTFQPPTHKQTSAVVALTSG